MQIRIVFNLVNQSTIVSDWEKATYKEASTLLEKVLENLSSVVHFECVVCGRKRYIMSQHITDIFIEEQDETKF